MKNFLICVALLSGCSSPAADYVAADAAAWAPYDEGVPARLDAWVDADPSLSTDRKDALHQLNEARRARIHHAQLSVK